MNERPNDLPYLYLRPGEMHFSRTPVVVGTILGSCLSVTFYSRRLAAGAICHALLPGGEGRSGSRYVDYAILHMLDEFARVGAPPHELDAKLFGGADMFGQRTAHGGRPTVGRQNIIAARATLDREGVTVSRSHLGGNLGRKLYFYPHSGDVLLKRVARTLVPEGVW
ncbi:MAG TPA: chemotaxis protein CheD [Desulfuromonadales bacterium]|nr:chemotaxis protein CheD [Desulfuromonadales bacterium]